MAKEKQHFLRLDWFTVSLMFLMLVMLAPGWNFHRKTPGNSGINEITVKTLQKKEKPTDKEGEEGER